MPPKRGSGQGKNQKTTRRGRSPERREATPESFVPDATWVEMTGLDLHGKYMSFRPPPEFMQAMVHDAKNWSETDDRSVIRTVAGAVAKVVMPILIDFQMWRLHINNHLQRLCASRRLFRCETQRFVTRLGERCSDLEEQISQFARIVPQLQERCNDLDERTSSLRSQIKRLESEVERLESEGRSKHTSVAGASTPGAFAGASTPGASAPSPRSESAATVRERSNDRSRDHAASSECPRGRQERDPLDAVFEAKLEAIRSRSNSPAAHKAQAWLEYSQRKQAQAAEDREADWHPDLV